MKRDLIGHGKADRYIIKAPGVSFARRLFCGEKPISRRLEGARIGEAQGVIPVCGIHRLGRQIIIAEEGFTSARDVVKSVGRVGRT